MLNESAHKIDALEEPVLALVIDKLNAKGLRVETTDEDLENPLQLSIYSELQPGTVSYILLEILNEVGIEPADMEDIFSRIEPVQDILGGDIIIKVRIS